MRKFLFIIGALLILTPVAGFADRDDHMTGGGHMMGSPGYGERETSEQQPYGMMGYGGYGMMGAGGCGMMGGHGMGPGMMGQGGYGMGSGMMGHHQMMHGSAAGMMGGCGMGSGMMRGFDTKEYDKFMNDTKDLRKKLHDKKFEYIETMRQPDTTRKTMLLLQEEMYDLQKQIYEKSTK